MSLFRKNALDALSTPEKLDSPMELLRPSQWVLLLSLAGLSIAMLIWAIFGKLPIRISGRGILIRTNSLIVVQSETEGRILSLTHNIGDCVKKGQLMATIDPISQELVKKEAEMQLQYLVNQDEQEDQLGMIRIRQQQAEIDRIENLAKSGAISIDQLSQRQKELSSLVDSIEARNGQREEQITQQRARIKAKNYEINRTAKIRAPVEGCVVDRNVYQGEVVQPRTTLLTLEKKSASKPLESLVFFPAGDGKRLSLGQQVRIHPSNTKPQRHGGIEGKILKIRRLPINDKALTKRLGLESLLKAIGNDDKEPLIEVKTSLKYDSSTFSGYDWGGGPGPKIKLTAGTPTNVRVLVEERRPISYVIPILRNLSGIY